MTRIQSTESFTPAALLEASSRVTPLRRCDVVYLRLGLNGFVTEKGRERAVLTPIDKDGRPLGEEWYYADSEWIIPGKTCVQELQSRAAL